MSTVNAYVGPQDGWAQVLAGGGSSVRISSIPASHTFFVYGGAGAPAANVIGVQVNCGCFQVDNDTTDDFYIRVPQNVPNSTQADGRLRLDVYAGPPAAP